MSSDFHTHTHCSPDSSTPVAKVLEVALQRGLHAIAITDHAEIDPTGFGFVSPHCRSYEAYRQAVLEAAAAYEGRLKILLGVEVATGWSTTLWSGGSSGRTSSTWSSVQSTTLLR